MKSYLVIVAKTAIVAIDEQAQLIMRDKPLAAAKWVERLWDKIESLQSLPHRNSVSEEESRVLGFHVRKLIFGTYFIFYRIHEEKVRVEVVRFRHAAQLPENMIEPDVNLDN